MKKSFLFRSVLKRIVLFSAILVISSVTSISNAQSFIKWNNAVSIGVGYTKLYKDFSSKYEGVSAPSDLVHFDFTLYGIYLGLDAMAKKTGYDVYGFDERVSTFALKLGPSFYLREGTKTRQTITPYAGVAFYTLSDTSENNIGARDSYGIKESKFIFGCKLAAIHDWYYIGFHFSNRECGLSVGVELEL